MIDAVFAEIRVDAIRRNLAAIRKRVGPKRAICVAVKANAYGHGLQQVLPVLAHDGIEQVAVANLPEALQARQLGWQRPILCLGPLSAIRDERVVREVVREAIQGRVSFTIPSTDELLLIGAEALQLNRRARVEIKIDTGMGRMGLLPQPAEEVVAEAIAHPGIILDGVYTHFASADESDLTFARQQLSEFVRWTERLRRNGLKLGTIHAANSAATFRLPGSHLDKVRCGLAVYGYCDSLSENRSTELAPTMRVVSRLTAVRKLPPGHAVGYGRTFTTQHESLIGIVPIGYADGYSRQLSNNAVMTLEPIRNQGCRTVPVVGRISMDQTTVDLSEAGDVRVGDPVTIIDDDPQAPHSVEALARQLETIPYEITALVGERVRRVAIPELAQSTVQRKPVAPNPIYGTPLPIRSTKNATS